MVPPSVKQVADTGPDTAPETSQENAPPEDADGHAHRMGVRHIGAENATANPQDDSDDPKPKCDGSRGS